MIRLLIDSVACDPIAGQPLTLAWSDEKLTDPEAGRSGETLTFELLPTAAVDALFGAECHLYGTGKFNAALHKGELLADGASLLSGSVRLLETLWRGGECRYRVELRGGACGWAKQAAKQWFRELDVEYAGQLLPTDIADGWSDERPVKFLPVLRDRYEITNGSTGLQAPERLLSTDDYHPFLSLYALVQTLFDKAGYAVESAFMESPWFRSLYMSGAYASHDTRVQQQKMGFLARRKADGTTTANALGRVEANPFVTFNTVGNLVDAFSPQEIDETGATLTDAYSAGGCLRIENGELCFRPLTEVSAGFEYDLHYVTDYRIRSRTRLTGFDSVWLGEDADVRFELAKIGGRRCNPSFSTVSSFSTTRKGTNGRCAAQRTAQRRRSRNSRPARRFSPRRRGRRSPMRVSIATSRESMSPMRGIGRSTTGTSAKRGRPKCGSPFAPRPRR